MSQTRVMLKLNVWTSELQAMAWTAVLNGPEHHKSKHDGVDVSDDVSEVWISPDQTSHLASSDPERELPLAWPETNPSRVRLDSNPWGPK